MSQREGEGCDRDDNEGGKVVEIEEDGIREREVRGVKRTKSREWDERERMVGRSIGRSVDAKINKTFFFTSRRRHTR